MHFIYIVAGTASSTMEPDSMSNHLLENVDKDKLSQETTTVVPASSTLHSLQGKSADTESLEAEKSGSTVDQLIEEEFQEAGVQSAENNATSTEQEPDKKSEPDFQLSMSDVKELSSTVEIKSSNDLTHKLSSKLDSTEDLAVDMKHLVSDNNDSEIKIDSSHVDEIHITQTVPSSLESINPVLSSSSKSNLVENTSVDAKQKTTEKNELDSLSNEKGSSSMDAGATGSEENSNISDTQGTKSGFDSADSTNDVDSFITQEAVQRVIKLIDGEGGSDKKKDDLSSSNNAASSQNEDSAVGVQKDCSSANETESPRTCKNEEYTDDNMKKVEQNVLDNKSKRDVVRYPENSCPSNKQKLDDDNNTETNPVIAIDKVEGKIGNLKIIEDDKVEKINSKSVIGIKEDLLKDESKQEYVDIKLEEKDKNKQQIDSTMAIKPDDQISKTNELVKKAEIQETSVGEIPNENTPQLMKPLDKTECKVTHLDSSKSSPPAESILKMDMTEKDVPDKNSKVDLVTNSINRPCGLTSNESLQISNQDVVETGNGSSLSKKDSENLLMKDTDTDLMGVDEQILSEKESLSSNTQSLSTTINYQLLKSKIENKMNSHTMTNHMSTCTDNVISDIAHTPGDKNIETNPTVSQSSASRKNLESKAPDLVEPKEAGIADPSSMDLEAVMRSALAKNEEFRKTLSSEYKDLNEDMIEVSDIELICLDDDDEAVQIKRPPEAKLCVNPNCMSGVDLHKPANFVLTYFKLKKAKNQLVCAECFDVVCKHKQVSQKKYSLFLHIRVSQLTIEYKLK